MIGSYAGITFNDFVIQLTPVVIAVMVAQIIYNKFYYGKEYHRARVEDVAATTAFLKEKYKITYPENADNWWCDFVGCDSAIYCSRQIAHGGECSSSLWGRFDHPLEQNGYSRNIGKGIEWPSLIFFITLFIVVGRPNKPVYYRPLRIGYCCVSGKPHSGGPDYTLGVGTSARRSSTIFRTPRTMLPIVAFLGKTIPGGESGVPWWALSLGVCFGGNGTIIGASANVVTTGG